MTTAPKLTTRLFPPVRRVRVWALVDPGGLVVFTALFADECRSYLIGISLGDHDRTHEAIMRRARRAGWRVRRLRPDEVAP